MGLNILRDKAYKNAVAHGWHDEGYSTDHWLCLIISELMEAVQADRNGRYAKIECYKKRISNSIICNSLDKNIAKEKGLMIAYDEMIKDTVEDELADACIRLFDLAGLIECDLDIVPIVQLCNDNYSDMSFTESVYNIIKYYITDNFFYGCVLDILNEIFAFCRERKIDISWHIQEKMEYNELRPYKHGNKKY